MMSARIGITYSLTAGEPNIFLAITKPANK